MDFEGVDALNSEEMSAARRSPPKAQGWTLADLPRSGTLLPKFWVFKLNMYL